MTKQEYDNLKPGDLILLKDPLWPEKWVTLSIVLSNGRRVVLDAAPNFENYLGQTLIIAHSLDFELVTMDFNNCGGSCGPFHHDCKGDSCSCKNPSGCKRLDNTTEPACTCDSHTLFQGHNENCPYRQYREKKQGESK